MNTRRSQAAFASMMVMLAACGDPIGPDVAIVHAPFHDEDPSLAADVFQNTLRVEIRTMGNPCTVYHHDDVHIDDSARVITVRPYNRQHLGVCHDIGQLILHKVRIDPGPGTWLVRAIDGGGFTAEVQVSIEQRTAELSRRRQPPRPRSSPSSTGSSR